MERYLVLSKLFEVSAKLKKHRFAEQAETVPQQEIKKLSGAGRAMVAQLYRQGTMNQRAIASAMHITAQAVSETVKKSEQGGFVQKIDGDQNNENLVSLTEIGIEVGEILDARIKNHAEFVFDALSDDELNQFYHLLSKMNTD